MMMEVAKEESWLLPPDRFELGFGVVVGCRSACCWFQSRIRFVGLVVGACVIGFKIVGFDGGAAVVGFNIGAVVVGLEVGMRIVGWMFLVGAQRILIWVPCGHSIGL
jgi:hypothetical protein